MAYRPAYIHSLFLLLSFPSLGRAQESPLPDVMASSSPNIVSYDMDIHLKPDGHTIRGNMLAIWRNQTEASTSEVYWHVYNNAWKDRNSVHLTEGRSYGSSAVPREWGGTTIDSLQVQSVDGSWLALQKDDWVAQEPAPQDQTVLRTTLPTPVLPGSEVRFRMSFTANMPPAFRRSGYGSEGYLHAVQWYPKFGVFEELEGKMVWNCEPYHYLSEFYADYGTYNVKLHLPAEYAGHLVSSGSVVGEPQLAGDTVSYELFAEDIHDFAWTVDPQAEVIRRVFVEEEWRDVLEEQKVAAALGRPVELVRPKDTEMFLMLQPEHAEYEEQYFTAMARSIYYYGLWFGSYPYETISCVDPAHDARATGGMEYPRLFTVGVRKGLHDSHLSPEGTTVHEFGHQFWYGLVGSDEFRHAFLDEGFTTYSTSRVLHKAWEPTQHYGSLLRSEFPGKAPVEMPNFGVSNFRSMLTLQRVETPDLGFLAPQSHELRRRTSIERWLAQVPSVSFFSHVPRSSRTWNRKAHKHDWGEPIAVPTYELFDGQLRRTNSYTRPAMTLFTLQELMGETRWIRLMRAWSEQQRFRHPKPEQWAKHLAAFGAGAKAQGLGIDGVLYELEFDWVSFWKQAYQGNDRMDFGVALLSNKPSLKDALAGRGEDADPWEDDLWDVRVGVRRYDGFRVPVEIRIHWSDGAVKDYLWDGQGTIWELVLPRQAKKVMRVQVDPQHKLMLDRNRLNNERREEPEEARAWNYGVRSLIWAQQVLHWYGGMG